jgi:predicted lipoprotein with Yx(FWY)xxD motif
MLGYPSGFDAITLHRFDPAVGAVGLEQLLSASVLPAVDPQETRMKKVVISLVAAGFLAGMGLASVATAQENTTVMHKENADGGSKTVVHKENADGDSKTVVHKENAYGDSKTVVHKDSADGEHSKTRVAREDGSKTIVKRGRHHIKRVDIEPNGDKTIIKKEKEAD